MGSREREVWDGPVRDEERVASTTASDVRFRGAIWEVRTDSVEWSGQEVERDLLIHPGAVAVIALDDRERVYLLRQYRHPVGMMLFEPPAGVMDRIGDGALVTARRELVEEAGLEAGQWHTLIDFFTSPGSSTEAIRVFLARGIAPAPDGRTFTGEAEETSLPGVWVPLDEAISLVLEGRIMSPSAAIGILAAGSARALNWRPLRDPHEPWRVRAQLARAGRVFSIKGD